LNFSFKVVTPSGKLFWTNYAFPRFLKKNKIDIAHVQYLTPLWPLLKTKIITTVHDVSFRRMPEFIQPKDRLILKGFFQKSLKRAATIITVSCFTKKEIEELYPKATKDKVRVVYNGVSAGRFRQKEKQSGDYLARVKRKYNLPERFILHISSLQPRKNVTTILRTFREYLDSLDNDVFLVIGGAKGYHYDKKIEELKADLTLQKRTIFIGYIGEEDLAGVYSLASLYVSLSLYEGFDLPLVEAMASGVPVLASSGSCHEEIIGGAGMLASGEGPKEIVLDFKNILEDKKQRKELIERGLKRAGDFSWKKCAEETLLIYKETMAKSS
jgi:glycosyltransferase involved in cell wall biosynthesis